MQVNFSCAWACMVPTAPTASSAAAPSLERREAVFIMVVLREGGGGGTEGQRRGRRKGFAVAFAGFRPARWSAPRGRCAWLGPRWAQCAVPTAADAAR